MKIWVRRKPNSMTNKKRKKRKNQKKKPKKKKRKKKKQTQWMNFTKLLKLLRNTALVYILERKQHQHQKMTLLKQRLLIG